MEAAIGEKARDYGWGGASVVRNSQIWDSMLKEATGTVTAEPISGGCAEGRNRLSVEPRGLQRLAVGGEGPRCRVE